MPKSKPKSQPRGKTRESSPGTRRLKFDYIKSSAFRVIHVDGAWGGLRPDLNLHLNLYSERAAIPKSLTLDLDPEDLRVEQVTDVESREAVVREVDVCAIMDLPTARSLRDWLVDMVERAEERLEELVDGMEE